MDCFFLCFAFLGFSELAWLAGWAGWAGWLAGWAGWAGWLAGWAGWLAHVLVASQQAPTSSSSIKFDDFVHRSYTGIAFKSVNLFEYVQFINHIMQISNAHNPLMHSCALIA